MEMERQRQSSQLAELEGDSSEASLFSIIHVSDSHWSESSRPHSSQHPQFQSHPHSSTLSTSPDQCSSSAVPTMTTTTISETH